jgi:hypothetical protein
MIGAARLEGSPQLRRMRGALMHAHVKLRRPPTEISLLRRSMDSLGAGRPRCHHCHRNPLVGEQVHVYIAAGTERVVCELCRPLRREPPARTEVVHSPEHHRAVKAIPRAA